MAKFKYMGDPRRNNSGPESNTIHGITFHKGEATEVPDESLAERLRHNSHFAEVKVGRPPSKEHE